MKELVAAFNQHLRKAIEIAEAAQLPEPPTNITEVLVLGMGGSGIGGTIAAQVLAENLIVPVISCKDYSIPEFVSESTLIIASSYSGNTEETLIALEEARKKTEKILCVTSGGKLAEIAKEENYGCIHIPGGMPPRSAFGYSFPQIFRLLQYCGLINFDLRNSFTEAIELIEENSEQIQTEAMKIASVIKDKMTIIYAQTDFEGTCIRFRQQLNENSKKLCWHHVFPEMNHNELVGWRDKNEDLAVVILRNEDDLTRNKLRIELSKEVFQNYCNHVIELNSKGKNKLEHTLYLVHLCDWISIYVAELNSTDPIEIKVINHLKSELSKR